MSRLELGGGHLRFAIKLPRVGGPVLTPATGANGDQERRKPRKHETYASTSGGHSVAMLTPRIDRQRPSPEKSPVEGAVARLPRTNTSCLVVKLQSKLDLSRIIGCIACRSNLAEARIF